MKLNMCMPTRHKSMEIMLSRVKISHLLMSVPRHLLLWRGEGGRRGRSKIQHLSYVTVCGDLPTTEPTLIAICTHIWGVTLCMQSENAQFQKEATPASCQVKNLPIPHLHRVIILCPGWGPRTNMDPSFWTNVRWTPVAHAPARWLDTNSAQWLKFGSPTIITTVLDLHQHL